MFADVIEFEDGLQLVQTRGTAMQAAADAERAAWSASSDLESAQVEELCVQARRARRWKSPTYFAREISSFRAHGACERAADGPSLGAMKAIPLAVAGAFHTDHAARRERLTAALSKVTMRKPRIPVVSNVDARRTTIRKRFATC